MIFILVVTSVVACLATSKKPATIDDEIAVLERRIECKFASMNKFDGSYEKCKQIKV